MIVTRDFATLAVPMITDILHCIANHRQSLTREDARAVMAEILSGKCSDAQIAALLVALHMKGETVEEIVGFAEAIRAAAVPLNIQQNSMVDVSNTGRDDCEVRGVLLRDADKAIHDAPNRAEKSDKRSNGADGCKNAGASDHFAAGCGLDALKTQGDALLHAGWRESIRRQSQFGIRRAHESGRPVVAPFDARGGFAPGTRLTECFDRSLQAPTHHQQLDRLGEPYGPGQNRREYEADHDRFDHDIGGHEHAPR